MQNEYKKFFILNFRIVALLVLSFFSLEAFAGRVAFSGASITYGFRASQSLQGRFNTLLSQQAADVQQKVNSKNSIVALDYFFPTNFSSLRTGSEDYFRGRVDVIIATWLKNNDIVMIGLIPEWSELSAADQAYVRSAEGSPFASWFGIINSCCSARAKYVNARIKQLALSQPKIVILNWTNLITQFRTGKVRYQAESLFGDPIHLNNSGQTVLFKYFLGPSFQNVWSVRLNF